LKARCITRDLRWGTPVPRDGYEEKVFYVWFDAPIGYISITACASDEWQAWWKNENVELVQFMGKDNVPFHTVIFPSTLIATRDGWTLLSNISTTEYLNYEGDKFSKSRGVGVFGDAVQSTNIPAEIWRYYLLSNRPESQDSNFLWHDFQAKNNNELLKNLGNYINRALKFVDENYDRVVPQLLVDSLSDADRELFEKVNRNVLAYIKALDEIKIKDALRIVMAISALGNGYIQANEPWVLVKTDPARYTTRTNMHKRAHKHTQTCTQTHTNVHTNAHKRAHKCTQTCIQTCTQTQKHTNVHTNVRTQMHKRAHKCPQMHAARGKR
jgi:methionyl-tRNA synthetase